MTHVENLPGSLSGLPDDQLGTIAVALVVSEVQWSPDVAPAVIDRISRDAVTYPEQFDRRPAPATPLRSSPPSGRSAGRTVGRLLVFGVMFAVVMALVFIAATASAARDAGADLSTAPIEQPFAGHDGSAISGDVTGYYSLVRLGDGGGRILHGVAIPIA